MATAAKGITFLVHGHERPTGLDEHAAQGMLKVSVQLSNQRGPGESAIRVDAIPGEDVVVLTIANGPTLVLHPQDARDLMRAQSGGGTRGAIDTQDAEVQVSSQLGWPALESVATRGATRGWMGQVVLSAIDIITGGAKDAAVSLAASAITKKLDGGVDAGVYELSADALPASLKETDRKRSQVAASADGGPLLILIHGTFVDTISTFGKLWKGHPTKVRALFKHYGNRVYALDHPTLGQSPIANALTLVRALPAGAKLHLVTHSRGGLVAEVLARACGAGPLTAEELALFAGDKYKQHSTDLQALVKEAQAKGLKVERVVRVACPARGTTLASGRLDAYLSVLQWGLRLANVPIAPELVSFLHEVARRRSDPSELPGIEAMMPESPVVAWLNRGDESVPGDLRVVAGDMEGDTVGAWVKTLLSDAFYWTDNDLVVQTRSMYGGIPRTAESGSLGASFMLDRGGKVNHFNYFENERTATAIVNGLLEPTPAEFSVIGPLSWKGEDSKGTRAAKAVARSRGGVNAQAADRPAVFVLPGILGSNLQRDNKRIWLGFRFLNGLKKLAWDPETADQVQPDGPIHGSYDELIERLADSHEVRIFAYDWRRPIEDEARRLAKEVDAALAARIGTAQPVRLLAHSMGGLVARVMQLEAPKTWKRLMDRDGSRLLMLGTPNGGSWAPMQTLSGDDTFGNTLVAFGSIFDNAGARKVMAGMPGFIQLQAGLLDPALGLDQETAWQKLADEDIARLRDRSIWHNKGPQQTIYEWSAPPQAVLDQAVKLRRRLDAQSTTLGSDAQKMLLVVGHSSRTPGGIVLDENGLEYLNTTTGDGRVTLESALLPGVRTWKVAAEHGKLADTPEAFAGYIDLLTTGQTQKLEAGPSVDMGIVSRGGLAGGAHAGLTRSRPSRGLQTSLPPSNEADAMGLAQEMDPDARSSATTLPALTVAVLNADLRFVRQPLMVGHYRSLTLTGAESVIDRLVNLGMSRALRAGLYPSAIGTQQIFDNQRHNPDNPLEMARPMAAIVVGLGEEGKLRTSNLAYTVRQAILAYAQRLSEQPDAPADFEIASTLLGSGGAGVSTGTAAQAIAQGAMEANAKLQNSGWPQLRQITLVELYLDRATDAWRALQLQEIATPHRLKLAGKVQSGVGAFRRSIDSSYRGSAYDLISALHVPAGDQKAPRIAYTLDTKRARTEVRAHGTQATLLRTLVAKASNDANGDPQIGRTLFNLLIPVEMEPFLGGTTEMVIELEPETAGIPWELLNTNPDPQQADQLPWSIRSKLIRKLRLENFREQIADVSTDDNVLIIGEPKCDESMYPRLEAAREEAIAVTQQLTKASRSLDAHKVKSLVEHDDETTIINALFERPYRIVHIAGHGQVGANGGVVLSGKDTYLGSNEIQSMRSVPELVFLNCCHLAGREAKTVLNPYDRAAFAANMAEALIRIGVRCVIAAGWAVHDMPAKKFATSFYASLLRGSRFIKAVGDAREAAFHADRQSNTWAAYQCYGDPEWVWRRDDDDDPHQAHAPGSEFAGVASPVSLALALEKIAIESQYSAPSDQLDNLRYLDAEFAPLWGTMGAIAEAFGLAYAQLKQLDKAIDWYQIALHAEDGSASFRAAEQLANLTVRRAEKLDDLTAAKAGVELGIQQLECLIAVQATLERESLLGSAWKRLAMIEERRAQQTGKNTSAAALQASIAHYGRAEAMAIQAGADNLFYPAKNCIAVEVCAAFQAKTLPELDPARLAIVKDALDKAAADHPDFWSVAGQTELQLLISLGQGRLAPAVPDLSKQFHALKVRVPANWMWDSVYNEAKFVLTPYLAFTNKPDERDGAQHLLAILKELAGQ
jgi:CHAT domain-containing protein/pimeloyl-ACP methyl ester carboxylesterase